MLLEKEISFIRFIKFAMRYILVAILLVAIGLGIGATTALTSKKTNYEKYTATITLSLADYVNVSNTSSYDSSVLSSQISQIMETAGSAAVKSQAFVELKDQLYPQLNNDEDKLQLFNSNLGVSFGTNSLTVSFIYDVTPIEGKMTEENNRELAKKTVETYLNAAKDALCGRYSLTEDNFPKVFSTGEVLQNFDLSESILESNRGVSLRMRTALGGIAGALIAAMLIFALYLFDPRIKCVEECLPVDKATVLRAEDETAVVKLMARAKVAQARRIAVLSLSNDKDYAAWTEQLTEYLKKSGASVKAVTFTTENTEWLSYFQENTAPGADYELYFYNDEVTGIASYIASNSDLSAFFVDQRKIMAKDLKKNVEHISNDSYDCTIIHNTDRAYVG